jgi:membrane associated rhomboid family serine protease
VPFRAALAYNVIAMGFYDRDYQRGGYYDRQPGFYLGGPRTLTTNLVLVMIGIYVVQLLTRGQPPDSGWFTDLFSLHADVVKRPWQIFQFLTYGFLHDVFNIQHIIFNMLGLWFFGRVVEERYGRTEYLTFFLVAVVVAGAIWFLSELVAHRGLTDVALLGASGGLTAVLILFCLNFPHQMIYIWFVLPIPAWVAAIVFVGLDLMGAMGRPTLAGPNVAFMCHLGGALFAFLYFQGRWHLERMLPSRSFLERLKPKPKLRVHDPESAEETEKAVDDILKKIQEHGRDSLTRRERRILEEASRQYQKRRH